MGAKRTTRAKSVLDTAQKAGQMIDLSFSKK
jgi:hypothetical protein